MRRVWWLTLCLAPVPAVAVRHGQACARAAWPEAVALVDRGTKGAGIFGSELAGVYCTGTLVAPAVVLTAAHCVVDWDTLQPRADLASQVSVYAGPGRLNSTGPVKGQTAVRRAVIHPDFATETKLDVAVIALAAPLPGARPARRSVTGVSAGTAIESVGFGEVRPEGKVNTMGQKSCARRAVTDLAPGVFCSPVASSKTPSSGGDSGGPAWRREVDGSWTLAGTLFGSKTLDTDAGAVEYDCWADVAALEPWLDATVAELQRGGD